MAEVSLSSEDKVSLRNEIDRRLKTITIGTPIGTSNTRKDLIFLPNGLYAFGIWTSSTVQEYLAVGKGSQALFFEMIQERLQEHAGSLAAVSEVRLTEESIGFQISGVAVLVTYIESKTLVTQWLNTGFFTAESFHASQLSGHQRAVLYRYIDTCLLKNDNLWLVELQQAFRIIRDWATQRGILLNQLGYGEFQLFQVLCEAYKTAEHEDSQRLQALKNFSRSDTGRAASKDVMVFAMIWSFFAHHTKPNSVEGVYDLEITKLSYEFCEAEQHWASAYKEFSDEWCLAFTSQWKAFSVSVDAEKDSGFEDFGKTYSFYFKFVVEYFGSSTTRSLQLREAMEKVLTDPAVQEHLRSARVWLELFGEPASEAAFYMGTESQPIVSERLRPSLFEAFRRLAEEGTPSATVDWFVEVEPIQSRDMLFERQKQQQETEISGELMPMETDRAGQGQGKAKAPGMRPAIDVMNRIKWDKAFKEDEYVIGYEDRHEGIKEIGLTAWQSEETTEEFIPMHRIRHFRHKDSRDHIWNRKEHIDRVFQTARA